LVLRVADHVGQMLMQRAAKRDVENLRATTDTQQRHAPPDGSVNQGELERVALPVIGNGLVSRGVRLLAIPFRVDIPSACDDQAIQGVEDTRGDLDVNRLGRKQRSDSTRQVHPIDVDPWQQACAHIPHAGLRLL
jgi:hypothetical protein